MGIQNIHVFGDERFEVCKHGTTVPATGWKLQTDLGGRLRHPVKWTMSIPVGEQGTIMYHPSPIVVLAFNKMGLLISASTALVVPSKVTMKKLGLDANALGNQVRSQKVLGPSKPT